MKLATPRYPQAGPISEATSPLANIVSRIEQARTLTTLQEGEMACRHLLWSPPALKPDIR